MDRKLILILSMALMALCMAAQNSVEQRVNVIRQAYANRLNLMQNQPYDDEDQRVDQLTIAYNRARQSAITQEITEIVAGAGR